MTTDTAAPATEPKPRKSKGMYIVFSPEGPAAPTVTHATHAAAHAVAWMMAKRNPGQHFYVMQKAGRGAFVKPDAEPVAEAA